MINEGAKILDEGKAQRASDIDVVWINGYGWPVYRGGPMFYGDLVGPDKVLAKMKEFEATMGDDFKPARLLESVAAENKRLQDLERTLRRGRRGNRGEHAQTDHALVRSLRRTLHSRSLSLRRHPHVHHRRRGADLDTKR